jgi:hypothetical protein
MVATEWVEIYKMKQFWVYEFVNCVIDGVVTNYDRSVTNVMISSMASLICWENMHPHFGYNRDQFH